MLRMAGTVVNLENVSFRRGCCDILSDISWRIDAGRHWALLGANGSGKTTLLKIITGYEWPSSGTVSVLGEEFGRCDIRALRKTIGWVSTAIGTRLPVNDTAVDIVASGLEASLGLYRDLIDDEIALARCALEALGAGSVADQMYKTLSQGERQKVLIARGLVCQPKLLVLDEPCVGLDPGARRRFLADLGRFTSERDSPNIILVTHHIEEITPWISDVLMLKDGRAIAKGTPAEVLTAEILSRLFDCNCRVIETAGEYSLITEN